MKNKIIFNIDSCNFNGYYLHKIKIGCNCVSNKISKQKKAVLPLQQGSQLFYYAGWLYKVSRHS